MLHLLLSVLAVLVAISMVPTILSDPINQPIGDFTVPSWIKNNAGWWAGGQIDDSSFVSGIQWLILNDVITISSTQQGAGDGDNIIPSWVKNTAGWWAEDKIHDITFVSAIKFLINEGIMIVGQVEEAEETSECTFKGIPVTCPDEKVVVEISDFYMEVNSGSCTYCVSWAYVGKEYNFQIETYDEKRGNYIDGVEINVKIISKGGELRHNFGQVTTEDGIYKNSITIPSLDWYAENILSVTGKYYGVEKTIEKEFTVFKKGYSADPSTPNTAGSCTEVSPKSVTSQEDTPQGITFGDDGRKMFVTGNTGDDVNEYTLAGGPYCLGTASFVDAFSVSSQDNDPQALAFNDDGLKMFIVGNQNDSIYQYTLSENFDVSTASYASKLLDIDATVTASGGKNEDSPTGVAFNDDGLKMFIVGNERDSVHEFTLTENFDVSTASFVDAFSVSSQESEPTGIAFNDNGLKMFIVGSNGDDVNEYKLSVNFDVSTASFVDAFSVSSQDNDPRDIAFDPSGRYMFIVGDQGNDVTVYKLSENFDVSTAVVQSG
jgi:hypothetical protein